MPIDLGSLPTSLATTIELYRAMEMTFWLPQTEATLAEVEGHRRPHRSHSQQGFRWMPSVGDTPLVVRQLKA
jgi:hypothetical protein